ncbi:hypothetical protein BJF79_01840 [Actinomadura sp. CNU-125]|nr:hypothetical protein BJF79_01840 [Actinomadura sp. CNU-125]
MISFGEMYADGNAFDGGWVDGLAAHIEVQIRHLVGRGHREIALALPDDGPLTGVHRRHVTEVAAMLGIPALRPVLVPPARAGATAALRALLAEHPDVTAVGAFGDEAALRVLAAAHDLGIPVPDRLAVIGLDDSPQAQLAVPALTSVHIDAPAYGRRAARQALGLRTDDTTPEPSRVVLREST